MNQTSSQAQSDQYRDPTNNEGAGGSSSSTHPGMPQQSSSSTSSDRYFSCPRGHLHALWPRGGKEMLVIQKCERKCQYCRLELQTTTSLRKVGRQTCENQEAEEEETLRADMHC
ncbi:hypothetical protein F4777DRAFT_527872 [Nemania sp. FL0916]|nr:hypothetical protein F4777DRAFT_527872 [Nemania sp. FL0916]